MKQSIVYPLQHLQNPEFSHVEAFLFNSSGPLGGIQFAIEWEIQNICSYYAYTISGLNEKTAKLIEEAKERDAHYAGQLKQASDEDREILEIHHSRFRDRVIDVSNTLDASEQFLDETTVVSLWMIAERFLGQIYREFYCKVHHHQPAQIPYKFDVIKSHFSSLGVDLTASHLYADANECRVLNNAIKHGNEISTALKQFPFFHTLSGSVRGIDLEMQRYVNGVHNFLGSTIEHCHVKLGYTA